MATKITENKTFKEQRNYNTNKKLFTTFSNMRSIMVLLVLCKEALFT